MLRGARFGFEARNRSASADRRISRRTSTAADALIVTSAFRRFSSAFARVSPNRSTCRSVPSSNRYRDSRPPATGSHQHDRHPAVGVDRCPWTTHRVPFPPAPSVTAPTASHDCPAVRSTLDGRGSRARRGARPPPRGRFGRRPRAPRPGPRSRDRRERLEGFADSAGTFRVAEIADRVHVAEVEPLDGTPGRSRRTAASASGQLDLDQLHPVRSEGDPVRLMPARVGGLFVPLPRIPRRRVPGGRRSDSDLVTGRLPVQVRLRQPCPRVGRPHQRTRPRRRAAPARPCRRSPSASTTTAPAAPTPAPAARSAHRAPTAPTARSRSARSGTTSSSARPAASPTPSARPARNVHTIPPPLPPDRIPARITEREHRPPTAPLHTPPPPPPVSSCDAPSQPLPSSPLPLPSSSSSPSLCLALSWPATCTPEPPSVSNAFLLSEGGSGAAPRRWQARTGQDERNPSLHPSHPNDGGNDGPSGACARLTTMRAPPAPGGPEKVDVGRALVSSGICAQTCVGAINRLSRTRTGEKCGRSPDSSRWLHCRTSAPFDGTSVIDRRRQFGNR